MSTAPGNHKFNMLWQALDAVPFTPSDYIFDYDSTIARVPIDWPAARPKFRDYLNSLVPEVELADGMRVDEMEAAVLQQTNLEPSLVSQHREELESSLRGAHEPIQEVVDLIRTLRVQSGIRLFIVSNNLKATVHDGLVQLDLIECFTHIYGVDTVGRTERPESVFLP
jgi:phosphoglycolate phosphatase-like HAD superfamily hydrolase